MGPIWRVEMLGTLQARAESATVARFRTRRVGLLLAYLAYHGERSHARDELADMLWPEMEADLARRNLRQALSSLRRHLEPPSLPAGTILITKQGRVSLAREWVATDVSEFLTLVKAGLAESADDRKIASLQRAVDLYKGDLLPGYYEEWVRQERLNLEDSLVSALQHLVLACERVGRIDDAVRYVRLALAKDTLREDLHATLMRLYLASARPASALQHFEAWKERLATELKDQPGREIQALAGLARAGVPDAPPSPLPPANPEHPNTAPPEARNPVVRLPVQLTRFFGRHADRDRAVRELTDRGTRLLTLFGPAGTGKTRLSVEVGRKLAEAHGWNVWFVSLADVDDGGTILDAVVKTIRLPAETGASLLEVLRTYLTGPSNLLILDNLEHILDGSLPTIRAILQEIPDVSLLATSRQSLKLEAERELDLAALPIPDEEASPADLAEIPSIQLFVDRAQAVLPDFQITPHNARAIATLCGRLDGLPLAIEIAAGLSNAFTPSQLLQNLENRLEILRSRRRDLSDRHRSLRAAIDYSYDLLSPELQAFFVSLCVFRGGFTVEAAGEVALSETSPSAKPRRDGALRMALDLQERSLLRSDEAGEGSPARFRLLESFREYGAERLGEEAYAALRQRHADYYLRMGKTLRPGVADYDRDNRQAALQFFFERRCVHECVALLVSLQSHSFTGRETIQALVRMPELERADPLDHITLLGMLSKAHRYASEYEESLRVCLRALELAERMAREDQMGIFSQEVAVTLSYLGRHEEAIAYSERNLRYGEAMGDLRAVEIAYTNIGTNRWSMGDFDAALVAFHRSLDASKALLNGDPGWSLYYNPARVHLDAGNLDDGMQFAGECLRIAQSRGDEFGISMGLSLISHYHRLRGNLVAALATSHEALAKRRKVGFLFWTFNAIQAHALVLLAMGRHREAATLLAASRSVTKLNREVDVREREAGLAEIRAALSESDFEKAWAEGLAMNIEEAFRLAASHR